MGTLTLRAAAAVVLLASQAHAQVSPAASSAPTLPARPAASAASNIPASDMALVSQIAAHLAQAKGVRARFTQTQTLAAMKAPLVSAGSLLFFRERGVIWQVDTPYKATWVMSDAGIAEINAAGQRVAGRNAQGARGAAEISKMMRAMLAGDLSALYSQFDVEAHGAPGHWQMRLTPNQPQLAQAIRALQMSGGAYLQSVRIRLANGDVTQIDFDGSTAVTNLTPAERALFGNP
ncbi:Outer membrane lipoprotein carrier protein LolA [Burkholderia multivorans]